MAQRIESFNVTASAGSFATPALTLSQASNDVQRVEIYFPRGCRNLVTAQLLYAGTLILPDSSGSIPTGDGQTLAYDLDDAPQGNNWQAVVTNNDAVYPHTLRYTFSVNEVTPSVATPGVIFLLPAEG